MSQDLVDAATAGDTKKVQQLLDGGVDVNQRNSEGDSALAEAARRGHLEIVVILLGAKVDVNGKNKGGWTALHSAYRHRGIMGLLLDARADVNATTPSGNMTALHFASMTFNPECVKLLLDAGANIEAMDSQGMT